jgi:hypothetical protein
MKLLETALKKGLRKPFTRGLLWQKKLYTPKRFSCTKLSALLVSYLSTNPIWRLYHKAANNVALSTSYVPGAGSI